MSASDYRPFEHPNVHFHESPNGLTQIDLATRYASASLFVQGAHLTAWKPTAAGEVLFVSQKSHFDRGKAIRGGIPVCFPWFAARAGRPESPPHGFVRAAEWKVENVSDEADGAVAITFSFRDDESTRVKWPHPFRATYSISIGSTLGLKFAVENTGSEAFSFESALHTYFQVSDVRSVKVTGLEETDYLDKVDGGARKRQAAEPLLFTEEIDRVFVNTTATCELHDPGMHRRISVAKSGSATTVVWNPWIAKAAAMADFGDDEWVRMLCIETANASENAITLASGQKHEMTVTISLAGI